MLKTHKIFFFIFNICFHLHHISAQHHQYLHFTEEDGLPSNFVYKAFQDSKDYIWFATDKGAVKYDGASFRVFNENDGLPFADVFDIVEDKENRIWVLGKGKLCYIYEDSVYVFKDKISGETYGIDAKQASLTTAKNVYILSNTSTLIIHSDSLFQYPYVSHSKGDSLQIFMKHPTLLKSSYYHQGKVSEKKYHIKKWDINESAKRKNIDEMVEIIIYRNRKNRIEKRVLKNNTLKQVEGELINVLSEANNKLFFKDAENLVCIDTLGNILDYDSFLNSISFSYFFEDKEGNIWISTIDDGVYMLPSMGRKTLSYGQVEGLHGGKINDIVYAPQSHRLYISSSNDSLYQLYHGKIKAFYKGKAYNTANMYDTKILLDNEENLLLLGNQAPYIRYDKPLSSAKEYALPNRAAPKNGFVDKKNGDIYIPSNQGILFKSMASENEWKYIDSVRAYAVAKDAKNQLWIGRVDGLYCRFEGKETYWGNKSPLCKYYIRKITIDAHQNVWGGTENSGLYVIQPDNSLHFISETANHSISAIYIDEKEAIWVGTQKGLLKIMVTSYQPFAYQIQAFTKANGLKSNVIDGVSGWRDSIFVINGKEITLINAQNTFYKTTKPNAIPTYITAIKVNGINRKWQSHLFFPYSENSLHINYIALSYKSCGQIRYFYRLKGLTEEWSETHKTEQEYTYLPPGDYVFEVKAIGIDGAKSSEVSAVHFTIRSPFWATWLFRVGAFTLLIGGIMVYVWRVKVDTTQKIQINQKFAQLEMQALQSQMNPHFVFNALMAIQSFLLSHEIEKSNTYLVKFSRLIRMILESTRSKYIVVSKEIQLIKDYIALEMMRFEDKFELEFRVAEDINENAEIPAMFVQPFVENAINHGLLQKREKGLLKVHFFQENNNLCILIEDDGVGRKRANEIKQKSTKSHLSQGTFILQDRQRLFKITENLNIEILTEDIEPNKGTKVSIKLPLRKI